MPTVHRFDGLRVVIYPNDHRPAHVHVKGADGEAVFILHCPDGPPELRETFGFNRSEVGRIKDAVAAVLAACARNGARFMAVTQKEFEQAEARMQAHREAGHAVAARYDRRASRIVVSLNTGVELAVPVQLVEGLANASADELFEIEISPTGLGLHWPKLDADVYVPGLLQGVFGSKRWMAQHMGMFGGRSRSAAKAAASRENGRKGGRPRKSANG
jgi:hypothetical protein